MAYDERARRLCLQQPVRSQYPPLPWPSRRRAEPSSRARGTALETGGDAGDSRAGRQQLSYFRSFRQYLCGRHLSARLSAFGRMGRLSCADLDLVAAAGRAPRKAGLDGAGPERHVYFLPPSGSSGGAYRASAPRASARLERLPQRDAGQRARARYVLVSGPASDYWRSERPARPVASHLAGHSKSDAAPHAPGSRYRP